MACCCRVGAAALLLAQTAWLLTSLRAPPAGDDEDLTGRKALAVGTVLLAVSLTLGSVRLKSLTVPAATVSLIGTFTTWWYASGLRQSSALSRSGYGASLFSASAALLLLASDMHAPPEQPRVVIVFDPFTSASASPWR